MNNTGNEHALYSLLELLFSDSHSPEGSSVVGAIIIYTSPLHISWVRTWTRSGTGMVSPCARHLKKVNSFTFLFVNIALNYSIRTMPPNRIWTPSSTQ